MHWKDRNTLHPVQLSWVGRKKLIVAGIICTCPIKRNSSYYLGPTIDPWCKKSDHIKPTYVTLVFSSASFFPSSVHHGFIKNRSVEPNLPTLGTKWALAQRQLPYLLLMLSTCGRIRKEWSLRLSNLPPIRCSSVQRMPCFLTKASRFQLPLPCPFPIVI